MKFTTANLRELYQLMEQHGQNGLTYQHRDPTTMTMRTVGASRAQELIRLGWEVEATVTEESQCADC